MMQTVQLAIADGGYAAALRDALSRSCAWHVESVQSPDPARKGVLVLDEFAFARQPLPLINPERVVLISHHDPQLFAQAWDAGIVSVVSQEDPLNTVLLAVMAAALRVAKPSNAAAAASGISPSGESEVAPISPRRQNSSHKRCKTQ